MSSLARHKNVCKPKQRSPIAGRTLRKDDKRSVSLGADIFDGGRYSGCRATIRRNLTRRKYNLKEGGCSETKNLLSGSG